MTPTLPKPAKLSVVILAGGNGTRLWPLSRKAMPKQFQKLVGQTTLFQEAVKRARLVAKPADIYVATNEAYVGMVRAQAPSIPAANIIAEPSLRDTATSLGFAATVLESRNPGGVMAVLYADHLIHDTEVLRRKLLTAAEVARRGFLTIIEVKALFAATQLGWVKIGKKLGDVLGEEVFSFEGFTEKPDAKKAYEFYRRGNYLWNTGLYVWRTDILLAKYAAHLPDTAKRLAKMGKNLKNAALIKKEYTACEKISVDYGVMEKVDRKEVAILAADLGWSDVGTWGSLKDELSPATENLVDARHLGVDTTGCFVRGDGKKLIATIGLTDMIIVDAPDALLICPKARAGDVKLIVEQLKDRNDKKDAKLV